MKKVNKFLNPKSIAVVGASENQEKVGYILMQKLKEFKGIVIPINLNKDLILGKRAYSSIKQYTKKIDLVIIVTPAKTVEKILEDCGEKKIKNVMVISAGFSEEGNIKLENEILKKAKKYKINLLGPNCFGVSNPYLNFDTTFSKSFPKKGTIAFISQSGALWSYISDLPEIGFSGFVSLGNMSDLTFVDFIRYFQKDKNTKKIILYIEKLKKGKKFIDICKKSKKEIIVVKAGRSKKGSEATLSHTGSLATDFEIYKCAFKQAKVKMCETLIEALNQEGQKIDIKRKKIAIITNAGGAGALITDILEKQNIGIYGPIDLLGTAKPEDYIREIKKLKYKKFNSIIFILTPQYMSAPMKLAEEILKLDKLLKDKITACFLGGSSVEKAVKILKKNKIKVLTKCC